MKKFYTFIALSIVTMGGAQVPNGGFEQVDEETFTLRNWGAYFPIPTSIDMQTGETTEDVIAFQCSNGFSAPAGNCLTGSWSMMLTNAFNITKSTVIAGRASLFSDAEVETHVGWNNGVLVAPGTIIDRLGFDYQFFPAGENEVVEATLEVFGATGSSIGKATIELSGFQPNFTYVYTPLHLTSSEAPVFMTIAFNMAAEGSEPTFGSMLFVDNVKINALALDNESQGKSAFTVFPTIAESEINLVANDVAENVSISIADMGGKTVMRQSFFMSGNAGTIDVSGLNSGVYILTAESESEKTALRFIKK